MVGKSLLLNPSLSVGQTSGSSLEVGVLTSITCTHFFILCTIVDLLHKSPSPTPAGVLVLLGVAESECTNDTHTQMLLCHHDIVGHFTVLS